MAEALAFVELEPVEQIHATLVDRIAKDELKLPLLPQVATEVLNLTSDPDADMTKLATLIQQDQAIAGQVLKIANSAAYAPRSPIVSMQQAVSWLGMKMLGELALTVSIESGVFRVHGYEPEITSLWRHALASGLYAKEIARQERHKCRGCFSQWAIAYHWKARCPSSSPRHSTVHGYHLGVEWVFDVTGSPSCVSGSISRGKMEIASSSQRSHSLLSRLYAISESKSRGDGYVFSKLYGIEPLRVEFAWC